MSRNFKLWDIFLFALTLYRGSCFSVDGFAVMPLGRISGFSTMLPLQRGVYRYCSHGMRHNCRQATSIVSRSMTTVKPSAATLVDPGYSNRSEEVMSSLPKSLKTWFDISLPEGRCIGVETTNEMDSFPRDGIATLEGDHWLYSAFHRDEVEFGMQLKKTRNSFWLGRLALRQALDFPDYPILKDKFGRPEMKDNLLGSISHKPDKGVAMVSPPLSRDTNLVLAGIGVDLEMTSRPGRPSLAKRILTTNERETLGKLSGITVDEEVMLRFSLKEAIYKAAHPLLCQYVSFQEAEVTPHEDGTASCTWLLDSNADEKISDLTAHWQKIGDDEYFLTSASVYTRPN